MSAEEQAKTDAISKMSADGRLAAAADEFMRLSCEHRYSYNFSWLGRPVIQYPQDLIALQEIIWLERPHLIVETGVAHGGSSIFFASMLELLGGDRDVLAIDIDIRPHNRAAIESHPLSKRITLIEGSSTDEAVVAQVKNIARERSGVLVVLDSNHTHEHVLRELELYSPFVRTGGHLVVLDTIIERLPEATLGERPWKRGDNPMTAVREFLRHNDRFVIDEQLEAKLLISVAPSGYLRCIRD
jgi:cephalosporin hydroxylase